LETDALYQTQLPYRDEVLDRLETLERRLLAEVQTRDRETADLYHQLALLRAQVDDLKRALARTQAKPGRDWFADWQRETRPQSLVSDKELLRIMGTTGYCLRRRLVVELHRRGAIGTGNPRSGGARRPFARLLKREIIEAVGASRESGGRPMEFFRLTARGREAYKRLYGREAAESEYDRLMRRHRSSEHVLLNLQAEEILEGWAEVVDLYPSRVEIPGVGVFDPDIVAVVGGRPMYVECERGRGKSREKQGRKWEIYARATGGQFHIFVPNKPAQERVQRGVAEWAVENQAVITLRICTVSVWRREQTYPPWTFERRYTHGQLLSGG